MPLSNYPALWRGVVEVVVRGTGVPPVVFNSGTRAGRPCRESDVAIATNVPL